MPNATIFTQVRNSHMDFDEIYFWTSTVMDWQQLLLQEKYKMVIVNSLAFLAHKQKIMVYGFVIMPNHVHLIWKLLEPNGKEFPHASFNKFTGHKIIEDLKGNHPQLLPCFKSEEDDRKFRIWQRDPLAILLDSKEKLEQKLEYIHNNPLQERWSLATRPEDYHWSSAGFYEKEKDDFGFLTHYREEF